MNFDSGTWALPAGVLIELQRQESALLAVGESNLRAYAPRAASAPTPLQREGGGVVIVPVTGVLMRRTGIFGAILGGTSTQEIESVLAAVAADPQVRFIVLEIDSPGGEVSASQGLANAVRRAAAVKEVCAWINGAYCASGAMWVASQADEIYSSTSVASVGSIGVVARHVDYSGANKALGITVSEVTAGKYKRIASSDAPLSSEGRATLQAHVDALYAEFLADVARGRGITIDAAEKLANGRTFTAREAVARGLIDGIVAIEDLFAHRRRNDRVANSPTALDALAAAQGEDVTQWPAILRKAATRVLADAGLDPERPVPVTRPNALRHAHETFSKLRHHMGFDR
jgi:signal peptide peptidase SppA